MDPNKPIHYLCLTQMHPELQIANRHLSSLLSLHVLVGSTYAVTVGTGQRLPYGKVHTSEGKQGPLSQHLDLINQRIAFLFVCLILSLLTFHNLENSPSFRPARRDNNLIDSVPTSFLSLWRLAKANYEAKRNKRELDQQETLAFKPHHTFPSCRKG